MVNINEKNIATWVTAIGGGKPNAAALQMARSLKCEPEFLGANNWQTPSTTKEGVVWKQQVYFAGFESGYSHGLKLNIECDCPAVKECIHALKIQRVYCSQWSYLFILFGMTGSKRFGELWSRAKAIDFFKPEGVHINPADYEEYEGGEVVAACGCVCNRADRSTTEYCEAHEADLNYRIDIAMQAREAARENIAA